MELNTKAIRLAMIEKRFNVASLSRAAGISSAALNMWLKHGTRPRLDKIGALAAALDVPVETIVKD